MLLSGISAFSPKPLESCLTRVVTISISVSISAGVGKTTILKRLFNADDISFTPLSRVFAVAIIVKPFCAGTSSESSGIEMRFSDKIEISAS